MSRIRQLATSGSLLCRNSGAEPNTSTRRPTERNRLLSASRTDASSSTTKTIGSSALAMLRGDVGLAGHGVLSSRCNGRAELKRRTGADIAARPTVVRRGRRRSSGRSTGPCPCRPDLVVKKASNSRSAFSAVTPTPQSLTVTRIWPALPARPDHQLARPVRDRLHRFDAVDHEIEDDLLQLDPIGEDQGQSGGEFQPQRHPVAVAVHAAPG